MKRKLKSPAAHGGFKRASGSKLAFQSVNALVWTDDILMALMAAQSPLPRLCGHPAGSIYCGKPWNWWDTGVRKRAKTEEGRHAFHVSTLQKNESVLLMLLQMLAFVCTTQIFNNCGRLHTGIEEALQKKEKFRMLCHSVSGDMTDLWRISERKLVCFCCLCSNIRFDFVYVVTNNGLTRGYHGLKCRLIFPYIPGV